VPRAYCEKPQSRSLWASRARAREEGDDSARVQALSALAIAHGQVNQLLRDRDRKTGG